jgi:hypothetical protein
MRAAQKDLALAKEGRVSVLDTAFALVINDDLAAGKAATDRDLALLNDCNMGLTLNAA